MSTTAKIIFIIIALVLLVSIPLTMFLVGQQQETRSRADTAACQLPGDVTNVKVNYPNCQGDQCDFEQASCTWDQVTDAATYNLKITEEETGNVVKQETLTPPAGSTVFAVTQGKTYRCDVTATNACGETGGIGTDSKLCVVEGILPTPTNTPAPTSVPVPTNTPVPTTVAPTQPPTPTPIVRVITPIPTRVVVVTIPPPGDDTTAAVLGIGAVAFSIVGMVLFLLL